MQLAWGEGKTGLEGAGSSSSGCLPTQHPGWEQSTFQLSGCVSAGRRCVFHSSLARGIPVQPLSVLVNRRGVFRGGRGFISGGTRPRGNGDSLFLRPQHSRDLKKVLKYNLGCGKCQGLMGRCAKFRSLQAWSSSLVHERAGAVWPYQLLSSLHFARARIRDSAPPEWDTPLLPDRILPSRSLCAMLRGGRVGRRCSSSVATASSRRLC